TLADRVEIIAVTVAVGDAGDEAAAARAHSEILGHHLGADLGRRTGLVDDRDADLVIGGVHDIDAVAGGILHAIGAHAPIDHEAGLRVERRLRESIDILAELGPAG